MSGRKYKSAGSWALLELYRLETNRVSLHVFTLLHGEDDSHELSGRVLWVYVYRSPAWLRIASVSYSWVAINKEQDHAQRVLILSIAFQAA